MGNNCDICDRLEDKKNKKHCAICFYSSIDLECLVDEITFLENKDICKQGMRDLKIWPKARKDIFKGWG